MYRKEFNLFSMGVALCAALAAAEGQQTAQAAEPETAFAVLLFDLGVYDPESSGDPVGIVLGAGRSSDAVRLRLGSGFGDPWDGEWIALLDNAFYASRGGIERNVAWGFQDSLPPDHGFMQLGSNSDAVVEVCEYVRIDGTNSLVPTTGNPHFLLVIIRGTVR